MTAGQLHGADRAEAWQRITATSPQFARFQEKTDRELPARMAGEPAHRAPPAVPPPGRE